MNTVNVKLTDSQLNKLKTANKNNAGTTLRVGLKMLNGDNLPHESLLTTSQRAKLRNRFQNNMWTDIKLSKVQISKAIQSGGFFGSLLSKLAGPLNESSSSIGKKYFWSIRNNNCCISSRCWNSKENSWFWLSFVLCSASNNFNNFKWRTKWHSIVQALEDSAILLKGVTLESRIIVVVPPPPPDC